VSAELKKILLYENMNVPIVLAFWVDRFYHMYHVWRRKIFGKEIKVYSRDRMDSVKWGWLTILYYFKFKPNPIKYY